MRSGLIKAGLFIFSLIIINGLFIGTQWLEKLINENFTGSVSLFLGFPLRVFIIIATLAGWYVSLYLVWKTPTQGIVEKIIIWFLRVVA